MRKALAPSSANLFVTFEVIEYDTTCMATSPDFCQQWFAYAHPLPEHTADGHMSPDDMS